MGNCADGSGTLLDFILAPNGNLYTKESCGAICPQTSTFRGINVGSSEPSTLCWCWYDDGTVPQEGVDRPAGFSAVTDNSGSGPIVTISSIDYSKACYKFRPNS
eukprot:scaffold2646_cov42-Cyclotella_meneghiniana.AAC.11